MGEMGPLGLTSLLYTLKHLHPPIFHFLLPQLHLQHLIHLLPLLPSLLHLLHLLHILSTLEDLDLSGSQSNGPFHSTTDRSGSPLQLFLLQMKRTVTLMTLLTSLMCTLPLLLSPELISNPSSILMQIYGTQHVRKRWRLTE